MADSLPATVLARIERELEGVPSAKADAERRRRLEDWLDQGSGACFLARPDIGPIVDGAIRHLDGMKYDLHAWVVMPNHVHALLSPRSPETLEKVMHSLKSFTEKEANRVLKRSGPFWQREYFDRAIRNADHFFAQIAYIEGNPVRAKLCERVVDWRFGSGGRLAREYRTKGIAP